MKYKNILILTGIVVILLLIVLITGKKPETKSIISVDKLKTIRIERQDDTTEIEVAEGRYRVVKPIDYPADSAVVAGLLNSLKVATLGEVISKREEKFDDFEVGDKGIKIILKGDKDVAFYIGKYAGDYQNSYFRFFNEKKVYLVRGLNKYHVDKKVDDWRDKTIFKIDKSVMEKIAFDDKEIFRQDTLWFYKDSIIEKGKIEGVLNNFSNLRATGFSDTSGFQVKNRIKLTAGGSEYLLELGEKKDYTYPVRLTGNNTIFLVSELIINSLTNLFPAEEKKKK